MTRRRRWALGVLVALAGVALAGPAAAHPLGNATVSRAVEVVIAADHVAVTYVVDMAEIPAFAAILEMDPDGDPSAATGEAWAESRCEDSRAALAIALDGDSVALGAVADPVLSFPPGVGGLETLRLECRFAGALDLTGDAPLPLTVTDQTDDGRRGWREIVIAGGADVSVTSSSAPAASPSTLLTAYPPDLLTAPPDVRSAEAMVAAAPGKVAPAAAPVAAESPRPTDPLASLLTGADDPIAMALAALLAAGLGAAHALSPGHGKALVAAYLIGSRGTIRRAVGLGLTVAGSHTIGVFVLGAIVLVASETILPERAVAWLSVASGILVVAIGGSVALRAIRARRAATTTGGAHDHGAPDHGHSHPNSHPHSHPHPHAHPHRPADTSGRPPVREVLTLGLVGGLVPSASALIVLLVAITTGRLVEGLVLIGSFGMGMAVVLAGLAAITSLLRDGIAGASGLATNPRLRQLGAAVPLLSAVAIVTAGAAATIGAIGGL
jgi:ABC-type nickel/cobalt efflux system permease component RcnA